MAWYNDLDDFVDSAVDATEFILTGGTNVIYDTYQDIKDAEEAAKRAQRQARQARIDAMRDRLVTSRSSSSPRKIIYGQAKTGGQVVFNESSGTDSEYLHFIVVFAAHSCKAVKNVYFGDEIALSWNGSSHSVADKFSGLIDFSVQTGKQAGADLKAVSQAPSWSASHKLLGQTYIYLRLKYAEDKYSRGVPNVTAIIEGKDDIYDPRSGLTGYTDNQALCALDYVRWSRGGNIADARIDFDSFATGADIADEIVSAGLGKTEKRYTLNGAIPFGQNPSDIASAIALAGAGRITRNGFTFYYVPGAYSSPSLSFNESDLIGGVEFSPRTPKSGRGNIAKGTFIDPTQDYAVVDFVHLAVDSYIQEDLEELEIDNAYEFTDSGTMARRISKIQLEKSRFGLVVNIVLKFGAFSLAPGDRIFLSISPLGWNNRIFRVETVNLDIKSGVQVSLREDSPPIYDWEEGDALEVVAPPALNLPNPLQVAAPINFSAVEELYTGATPSDFRSRAILTWSAGSDAGRYFEVQFRKQGGVYRTAFDLITATSVDINDLDIDIYDFRVRAKNTIGASSDWIAAQLNVLGKTAPPPKVDAAFVEKGILQWQYPSQPADFLGFKVRYHNGQRKIWTDAKPLHDGYITQSYFDVSRIIDGQVTFLIKAIDTSGNESLEPMFVSTGLGAPIVENVILQECQRSLSWPGSIFGGSINGSNHIEQSETGLFWRDDATVFWSENDNAEFWASSYDQLVYEFDFLPELTDLPSQLVLNTDIINCPDAVIQMQPMSGEAFWPADDTEFFWPSDDSATFWPGGDQQWILFPGSINATGRETIKFRVVCPSATAAAPAIIRDICIQLDVPDISEVINDFTLQVGGSRLPLTQSYRVIKSVGITLQLDGSSAVSVKIVDRDKDGPLLQALDVNLNGVSTVIDATVQGY